MRSNTRGLGVFFLLPLIALVAAVSCAGPAPEPVAPADTPVIPLEIIDQAGRVVSLTGIPVKIVSLAPSNTEIVYALGLADRLAGVTEYCDYPAAAQNKPQIGGFSTVNIEKVVEIQPDLILATGKHQSEIVPELERLGFTTLILAPKTIDEVMAAISLIGRAAGAEDRAAQLVGEMRARAKAITDKTDALNDARRPGVLYLLWHDPIMTAGSKTIINELIEKAGGINIAGGLDEDYPKMSLEAVIIANPQVIITDSGHGVARA